MRECPKCGTCFEDSIPKCSIHPETETKVVLPGPQTIANRYLLERRLGRGAMGQVYLARDENLGTRQVAVKTVRPDLLTSEDLQEGEAIARFEREARAAASIRHPNVVDVTDFGKSREGVFYLVMEYVKGETLHDLLRREGTLTAKRALALMQQIGAGVEAAHEANILHRDLKPANIFLLKTNKKNDDGFIKVGDFGLAKIVGDAQAEISAKQGPASRGIIGTPEFMAPEQMHSERPIDARADIYAMGTIAYLMLGGRVPFGGDLMQIISSKMAQQPPPLSKLRSDISPEIERAIMHALEPNPDKRPADVSAWLDELAAAVEKTPDEVRTGAGRVTILAPIGAEVYMDDERRGSIGSSGRVVLNSIPPGRHVLRVAQRGAQDDERMIEIREDSTEQVIQAVLRSEHSGSQPSASQPGDGTISQQKEAVPEVVICNNCDARFAAGIKFCGRCGQNSFRLAGAPKPEKPPAANGQNGQPQNSGQPGRIVVNTSQPGTINCPNCTRALPANAKFCGVCGFQLTTPSQSGQPQSQRSINNFYSNNQPQAAQVVCPRCRTIYKAGTNFCGRCGLRIA